MADHDDEALARFQSALLLLLQEDLPEAAVRDRLDRDPEFEPYRAEVRAMDPRALGIAARVVKRWARRAPKH